MDLVGELNRLAGNPKPNDQLGAAGAANLWAGTTGLELVGALNVKAGRPVNGTCRELNGVLKLLGFDLDSNAALVGGTDGTTNVANVLRLPGISGNYVSTPDTVSNSITGDIDIRVKLALDNWASGVSQCVLGKQSSGSTRSYYLEVNPTSGLQLLWSADGTATLSGSSTVTTGFAAGTVNWIRATLTVNNGAGGNDTKFYTSSDGVTWNQLGSTRTLAGTTSIFDSTSPVEIGSRSGGTVNPAAGRFYYAEVRNGIGGNVVVSWDASTAAVRGDTSPTTMHSVPFNLLTANQYDVETDTTGFFASGAGSSIARITSDFNTGAASLQLTTGASANPAIGLGTNNGGTFAVTPGQTYSFAGYVKSGTAGVGMQMKLAWYNAANGFISQAQTGWTSTTSWALESVTGAAPVNAAWVVPFWTFGGTPGAGSLLTVDTMALYLGTVSYPVAPATWTINGSQWYWDVYSGTKLRTQSLRLVAGAAGPISTPDAAGLAIAGDLDVRALVHVDDFTRSSQALVAQYDSGANQRSYALRLNINQAFGRPELTISTDGTSATATTATATATPAWAANNNTLWIRATLQVNNGSGSRVTTFYTSTDGSTWTQLGTPITTAGTVTLFNSTSALTVGDVVGGLNPLVGNVYYAEVRSGISGSVVASVNPAIVRITSPTTPSSWTGAAGNVWSFNTSQWNWAVG